MRQVIAYEYKGILYDTHQKALKELEEDYGRIAVKLARDLCTIDKFSAVLDYIKTATEDFESLVKIQKERQLIDDT